MPRSTPFEMIRRPAIGALLVLAVVVGRARAAGTDNHVLQAVPAPAKVVIDGDLTDWDQSGRIFICSDITRLPNPCSAWVSMMYDSEALYVGVDWSDPTPMINNYDPRFDVDLRHCFHSDSLQIHFRTDQERKVIGWFYTKGALPGVCVLDGWFPWHDDKPIPYIDGLKQLGISEAFRAKPDGRGYTQELRIPWKAIVRGGQAYKPNDSFDCMLDAVWGPDNGKGWPVNHMMDLVSPGAVHAGWFWEVQPIYGKVRLSPTGHLKSPEPDFLSSAGQNHLHLQKTSGPVSLSYTMPFDGFATLVIDDQAGHRVRNLIGMAPRGKGPQTDYWDGVGETGKLAPPGKYKFRGLMHPGIHPIYRATYGTPGAPPWETGDGTGAWLSDHCAPRAVATAADVIVLGAERGESGSSIIGVDLDGKKLWGESGLAGVHSLSADETHAFVFLSSWDTPPALARMELKTGKYAPFATPGGPQLKIPIVKIGDKPSYVPNIAVGKNRIAVPLDGKLLRFYDTQSGAVVSELPIAGLGCVAAGADGVFYVWTEGKIARIVDGKLEPLVTTGLPPWADGMAIGAQGNIFVSDRKGQQVRVYDQHGKSVRAIGAAGGRPAIGPWQAGALLNPLGIAIDRRGRLWVAEEDTSPKRISVWTPEGTLVRDFIGPTGYGGTGANADPDNPRRVFGSGCEFDLDWSANRAMPVARLGDVSGELLKAGGREYFMNKNGRLYLRTGDTLKLVAAMGNVYLKDLSQVADIPLPKAPADAHGYATISYVWSDLNDDGKPQATEVISGSYWSGWKDLKYPVGVSGYFGSNWLDERFNLYGVAAESFGANGGRPTMVTKIPLKGWTAAGAPLWDVAKQELLSTDNKVRGCLYLPSEHKVIAGEPITCVGDDGSVQWTYQDRWPGVHASHSAPVPERDDQLIGTLGCIGRVNTPLGTVFGMHSNMGRLYLMTTDGLFVASVFQDCRLGGNAWPAHATAGAALDGVTMGSEWFGGHLFQSHKTGDSFLIAGFTAYNLIQLQGLEAIQPISGESIDLTAAHIQSVEQSVQRSSAAGAEKRALVIAKVTSPPPLDGNLSGFAKDAFVEFSSGPHKGRAALAVDATNLYLAYDVSGDDNPMVNAGKDINRLFVTGDSVDLQLATDPAADPKRTSPAIGDIRVLISAFEGQPVAVLYRWKAAQNKDPVTFSCPWRSETVDRVEVLKQAKIAIHRRGGGYIVEAAIPLAAIDFVPQPKRVYKLDLGVIFSNPEGTNRAARLYWSNQATGLTSDIPGEIMALPHLWGKATIAP